MGLDQNIYRISRPNLEDRVFKRNELDNYLLCRVADVDEAFLEVIPYTTKRKVEYEMINIERMFTDKGIPNHAYLGMCSSEVYEYCWKNGNEYKSVEVSTKEIAEKYVENKIFDTYICEQEELQYWRKNYNVQDFIYDELDADNCKYCLLNTDIQSELINTYGAEFEVEENTEESGIFYWEWY